MRNVTFKEAEALARMATRPWGMSDEASSSIKPVEETPLLPENQDTVEKIVRAVRKARAKSANRSR